MTEQTTSKSGISLLAVLVGWLAIEMVGVIVGLVTAATVDSQQTAGMILLYVAGPLGALVGGYVAGGMAKRSGVTHGLLAACLTVTIAIVIAYLQVEAIEPLLDPLILGSWGAILLAGMIGGSFAKQGN